MQGSQSSSANKLDFCTNGSVAVVTIDNSIEQNRLTPGAIAEFERIADMLRAREDLHVLVITGSGREYFSTGILNPILRSQMKKEEVIDLVLRAASLFDAIEALPQVVIAGLNGTARAGGAELALVCDIRIAAEHAWLSMPEARSGGFPGAGGPIRLGRLIGRARALELICTGREFDSAEMERIGLVQRVVAALEFDQRLSELAQDIANSGPLAVRGAKKIMSVSEEPGFKAAREISDALRRHLEWSADVDEGIRAYQEERKPRFLGR